MRPSEEEALRIHRKYGSNDIIVRHCRAVAKVAMILAEDAKARGLMVDLFAVEEGALLHDIGRNRVQTVKHGFEGSQILLGERVDVKVATIVRKHVGAGLSDEEAKSLGLPDFGYIPETPEEVIVCFADKMVDGDKVRPLEEEVKRFRRKGHDVERLLALRRRVEEMIGGDPESLVFEKIKETQ